MIGWLKGRVIEKDAPELLLDVHGVGYELLAPMSTFAQLPERGGEVALYTHFVVREDAQVLYGFSSKNERSLFRSLIRVNGIGPKIALVILSGMDTQVFVRCVQNNDIGMLTKIPGIGRKIAERLLVEMRDRLKEPWAGENSQIMPTGVFVAVERHVAEAECALVALGYKPEDAAKMVAAVKSPDKVTSEQLIRAALRKMV